MDNLTLEVLLQELKPALLQKSIQKIKMTSHQALVLTLRSKTSEYLTISLDPSHPSIFMTKEDNSSGGISNDWLLTLRKYLLGGKIVSLNKELSERILFLECENFRVASQLDKWILVLELVPARTNALLLNGRQEILASCMKLAKFSESGPCYYSPPVRPSFSIDRITREEFLQLAQGSFLATEGSSLKRPPGSEPILIDHPQSTIHNPAAAPLWTKLSGISPFFVKEIAFETNHDPEILWQRLQETLKRIGNGPYSPQIYFLKDPSKSRLPDEVMSSANGLMEKADKLWVAPFPLESLQGFNHQSFPSLNAACATAYQAFCVRKLFKGTQRSLISKLVSPLKKKRRLLEHLQADLRKNQGFDIYKKYADLLYAQKDKSPRGQSRLRVKNLFDPQQAEIEIPLDPQLSIIQNANRYIKVYQKANRAIPLIKKRITKLEREIEQLDKQREKLTNAQTIEDIDKTVETVEPKQNLGQKNFALGSPIQIRRGKRAMASTTDPQNLVRKTTRSFVSSDGLIILVGKTSKDNDVLTLRIAQSEDFWFHVAGYGGSHVVLRNPEKLSTLPRQSLLEAAQLAAYFSQARNASKVEVHYTQKKLVSKPKGAKPGLVRLKDYKSVTVRPQLLSGGAGE